MSEGLLSGLKEKLLEQVEERKSAILDKDREEFEKKKHDRLATIRREMIEQCVEKIWDTYDCDGDDRLSVEEALPFFKDTLNVLRLKEKKCNEGDEDFDLDLQDAVDTLKEDFWRLFTIFDPEFESKKPDQLDHEFD